MPKFQVTVVQSREFSVAVDALHERDALIRAEARITHNRWDDGPILGDPPFTIEAIEAVLLPQDEIPGTGPGTQLAGGTASSSGALRPSPSSRDAGGARPTARLEDRGPIGPSQAARRFGLTALAALIAAPAPYFSFDAFLNGARTEIDFSKGWDLTIGFNRSPTDPYVFENLFVSENPGTSDAFSGPFDASYTYNAGGALLSEASVANNPGGVWTDPIVMAGAPEASTWAMLLSGFLGVALLALRRRAAPAPARARR